MDTYRMLKVRRERFYIQDVHRVSDIRSSDIWSFRLLGQFLAGPKRNGISYNKIFRIYGHFWTKFRIYGQFFEAIDAIGCHWRLGWRRGSWWGALSRTSGSRLTPSRFLRVLGTAAMTDHQSGLQTDVSISCAEEYRGAAHVNETMHILLKANYRVTHEVGSNLKWEMRRASYHSNKHGRGDVRPRVPCSTAGE